MNVTSAKIKKKPSFSHFNWVHGKIGDFDSNYPSYLSTWLPEHSLNLNQNDGHFLFVYKGTTKIKTINHGSYTLNKNYYAYIPGQATLNGGQGIVISRKGYKGLFSLGGPIEHKGRLKYIDGCTDSLLVPPTKMGDPCLNLLAFPENIDQTMHTHPSDRIGIIIDGEGECITPEENFKLKSGMLFCIHAKGLHKFKTHSQKSMRVLAYHPDSDFGPTDDQHPMINKTIIDGLSASKINSIHTKAI